jgi:hypothetical protein
VKQQDWIYLGQLVRVLQEEGVAGRKIGEMVAEIEQHLSESGADPVAEFGAPAELGHDLADRPGSKRRGWIPPTWADQLAQAAGLVVLLPLLTPWEWTNSRVPMLAGVVLYVLIFSVGVLWIRRASSRRLDGRTWEAITGWRFALMILGLALVVTSVVNVAGDGVLFSLPRTQYLVGVALLVPVLLLLIVRSRNPIRFPEHAQHLNRLKRGPFAGRPPVSA